MKVLDKYADAQTFWSDDGTLLGIILWRPEGCLVVGAKEGNLLGHKVVARAAINRRAKAMAVTIGGKQAPQVMQVIQASIGQQVGHGIVGEDGVETNFHPQRKYPIFSQAHRLELSKESDVPAKALEWMLPGESPSTVDQARCVSMRVEQ